MISKAKRDFGYAAAVTVKQGIERVVQVWFVGVVTCGSCAVRVQHVGQAVKDGRHPVHSPQAVVRLH